MTLFDIRNLSFGGSRPLLRTREYQISTPHSGGVRRHFVVIKAVNSYLSG